MWNAFDQAALFVCLAWIVVLLALNVVHAVRHTVDEFAMFMRITT